MKGPHIFHSIEGENIHYGTPRNPCAPDRIPGGSSSGSAVVVAAKLVDFALGKFLSRTIFTFLGFSSTNLNKKLFLS